MALPSQDDAVAPRARTEAQRRGDAVIESMRGRVTSSGDTKASNGNIANIV